MEITSIGPENSPIPAEGTKAAEPSSNPDAASFIEGDRIEGEVIPNTSGGVSVRLSDGTMLQAQLKNPSMILDGQLQMLEVVSHKNELILQIIEQPQLLPMENLLKDALINAGISVNPENLKIAQTLWELQRPLDGSTLQRFNQGIKLAGYEEQDAILLLMDQGQKINDKNIVFANQLLKSHNIFQEQANALAESMPQMAPPLRDSLLSLFFSSSELQEIFKSVTPEGNLPAPANQNIASQLPDNLPLHIFQAFSGEMKKVLPPTTGDPMTREAFDILMLPKLDHFLTENSSIEASAQLQQDLLALLWNNYQQKKIFSSKENLLPESAPKEVLTQKLMQKMAFSIEGKSLNDLEVHIEQLLQKLKQAKDLIPADPQNKELLGLLAKAEDQFQFNREIQNPYPFQYPIILQDEQKDLQLYVFKDKKGKNTSSGTQSALLALDMAWLGYTEVYIQKKGNEVFCQFRSKEDNTSAIYQNNMARLKELLDEKNYILTGFSCIPLEKPFNISKGSPSSTETKHIEIKDSAVSIDIRM